MTGENITLPSTPRVVLEEDNKGVYEIDKLYPGYGHTLGNSLRRIILSSLPGAAITSLKIDGVNHEFSVIDGVKEDVITILLNLKKIRFKMATDEPQTATLSIKGAKVVTAADITASGQLEVMNKDQYITELTDKSAKIDVEMTIERGLGFTSKEDLQKGKVEIGTIAVDAIFTPIQRASYEIENMRVGDKTNYNRLRITVETDGTITPREAIERSIEIMILQLQAVFGYTGMGHKPEGLQIIEIEDEEIEPIAEPEPKEEESGEDLTDVMKTRIETLNLSARTINALEAANIRTIGGVARKTEEDILALEGVGQKAIQEIKRVLGNLGITLKQ